MPPAREALRDDVEHCGIPGQLGDDGDRDDEPEHGRDACTESPGIRGREDACDDADECDGDERQDDDRPRSQPPSRRTHSLSVDPDGVCSGERPGPPRRIR